MWSHCQKSKAKLSFKNKGKETEFYLCMNRKGKLVGKVSVTSWVLGVRFSQIWKTSKAHPGPCWPYLEPRCGVYLGGRENHLMTSLSVTVFFVLVPAAVRLRSIYGCHLVPRAPGSDEEGCGILGQPTHGCLGTGNLQPEGCD